jgi:hypothetical protein
VYDDLQPYICLFTDCNLGLQTFQSRREWIDHEFHVHRVSSQRCCNLCKEVFGTQEIFRAHIEDTHQNKFVPCQIEEFIGASKRFVSHDGRDEKCPFCLIGSPQTQRSFASHVCRHLQEIPLVALPLLDASSDNEDDRKCDDEDDGNRSDHDRDRDEEENVLAGLDHTGEKMNRKDSGGDASPVKVDEAKVIPSRADITGNDGVPPKIIPTTDSSEPVKAERDSTLDAIS